MDEGSSWSLPSPTRCNVGTNPPRRSARSTRKARLPHRAADRARFSNTSWRGLVTRSSDSTAAIPVARRLAHRTHAKVAHDATTLRNAFAVRRAARGQDSRPWRKSRLAVRCTSEVLEAERCHVLTVRQHGLVVDRVNLEEALRRDDARPDVLHDLTLDHAPDAGMPGGLDERAADQRVVGQGGTSSTGTTGSPAGQVHSTP